MISAKNATDKKCNICPNKEECGFIKERAKISSANIIVANHALVLSDIHSNRVLPSPENAIYIFDEAHHLPKTFRETLGQSLNFSTL